MDPDSLVLAPRNERSSAGSDVRTLTDAEMTQDLGMTGIQIRKLREGVARVTGDVAAPPAATLAAPAVPAPAPAGAPTAPLDAGLLQQYRAARDEVRALEAQQVEQQLVGSQQQVNRAAQSLQEAQASQARLQVGGSNFSLPPLLPTRRPPGM